MKRLKDFLMIENLESYEYSLMLFLDYFTKDLKDEKLKILIAKRDFSNLFDYMWKNYKTLFLNKDIQTVFERYLLVKKSDLEERDILLNLSKQGIYIDKDDINLEAINLKENCLIDDERDVKIYNIENIIRQFSEGNSIN
jgi:hypothetical protein